MKLQGKLTKCYTPYVQQYVAGGGCAGYLGHENRTDETDILLEQTLAQYPEEFLNDTTTYELMGRWLCSKLARHKMDLLPTSAEFKTFITHEDNLEKLFEDAMYYLM